MFVTTLTGVDLKILILKIDLRILFSRFSSFKYSTRKWKLVFHTLTKLNPKDEPQRSEE